jgi:hypothetical protein
MSVFVYYYTHIACPFEQASPRLRGLQENVNAAAGEAYRDIEELRVKLGIRAEGDPRVGKTVAVRLGPPLETPYAVTIPINWEATGLPSLFPTLAGELTLAPLGSAACQLALRGTYEPPLGALGRVIDRALLQRVAEAGVKSFVDRIAQDLEAPAGIISNPDG